MESELYLNPVLLSMPVQHYSICVLKKKKPGSFTNKKTWKKIKDDLQCRGREPSSPSSVRFLHGTARCSGEWEFLLARGLETSGCRRGWVTGLTFGRKGWWGASCWAEAAFRRWMKPLSSWRVVTPFLCLSLVSCHLGIIIF